MSDEEIAGSRDMRSDPRAGDIVPLGNRIAEVIEVKDGRVAFRFIDGDGTVFEAPLRKPEPFGAN